jgi:hypothetical protein
MFAILVLLAPRRGAAVEAAADLSIGRDFAWLTADLTGTLLDGDLALGGGLVVVSDLHSARFGLRALGEVRGERATAGLLASLSPAQDGRSWIDVAPRASVRLAWGRVSVESEGEVTLRRIATATRGAVDQLRISVEGTLIVDETWRLGGRALLSFYDPDPAGLGLRGADLGPAVALASRPEKWAVGARLGRRLGERWRVEVGLAGLAYADGPGGGVVPRAAVGLGPVAGLDVEASLELVVGLAGAERDPVRVVAGLALAWER